MKLRWVLLGLLAVAMGAHAQDSQSDAAQQESQARAIVSAFQWRDGQIAVDEAKARFQLDSNFRYLGAADARKVLEDLWGNPPDDSVLGMVVP